MSVWRPSVGLTQLGFCHISLVHEDENDKGHSYRKSDFVKHVLLFKASCS